MLVGQMRLGLACAEKILRYLVVQRPIGVLGELIHLEPTNKRNICSIGIRSLRTEYRICSNTMSNKVLVNHPGSQA